ncbi:HdeD family acid-resistance protein [Nocardiopsis potens]|uniref:HdeD family acid-resistance protein n=1 Tax=Nocardiopsis potens TaxID=1246458 RepID=UPI001F4D0E83|nr:HdeD family acid-resistance protein [Nocardiopsis potens]
MIAPEGSGHLSTMLDFLSRNWWVLTVRGVAALLFGLLALFWPEMTAIVLALLFGAYALVDGVLAGVHAVQADPGSRIPLVVEAVVGILLGIAALLWPVATVVVLTVLIGAWAVITGIVEIIAAIRLRKEITGEWLYILSGVLSVCFGLLLWFWPLGGAVAIALIIGVYAVFFGIVLIFLSLRLRKLRGTPGPAA